VQLESHGGQAGDRNESAGKVDVPEFLYDMPRNEVAVWFSLGSIVVVLLGLLVLKPILRLFVPGDASLNETIGISTASFSLFYGLLLGLLTVAAYQNRDRTQTAILNEASAIGAVYSSVASYPEPWRTDLREMLRDYVQYTIHRDWPKQRQGLVTQGGTHRINAFGQWLARFEPGTAAQQALHGAAVSSFESLKTARQMRLNGVNTRLPPVLWYAVIMGAAVSVLVLLLVRARPMAHFVLASISTFFLGVILFVILALDAPLRGPEGLSAKPYEELWDQQMAWDELRG
jgi:hypothetical protein